MATNQISRLLSVPPEEMLPEVRCRKLVGARVVVQDFGKSICKVVAVVGQHVIVAVGFPEAVGELKARLELAVAEAGGPALPPHPAVVLARAPPHVVAEREVLGGDSPLEGVALVVEDAVRVVEGEPRGGALTHLHRPPVAAAPRPAQNAVEILCTKPVAILIDMGIWW